jgi:hypothetical protein
VNDFRRGVAESDEIAHRRKLTRSVGTRMQSSIPGPRTTGASIEVGSEHVPEVARPGVFGAAARHPFFAELKLELDAGPRRCSAVDVLLAWV